MTEAARDQLSFMRFAQLSLPDSAPDAKTNWLFREHLTRGALEWLLERFDAELRERELTRPQIIRRHGALRLRSR